MNTTPHPRSARRARRLFAAVALPVLLLGVGACSQSGEPVATSGTTASSSDSSDSTDPSTSRADADAPGTTADPGQEQAPLGEHESVAAQISKPAVKVHADASADSKVITTLGPSTALGSKTTVLVVDQHNEWAKVSLPIRPNGSTGWVRLDDVELRSNPMAVRVDRATHTLTVTHEGNTVLETPVAIGSKTNPTPAGAFYVTDLVDTGSPSSAYGPFAFGLSGHSDTLSEFGGGDGQLGVHGTDDPSSIGRSVSHGCVRVPNDIAVKLVSLLPLGTPVTIV